MASEYLNLRSAGSFVRLYPVEAEEARLAALDAWYMDMVLADVAETAVPPPELVSPISAWWRKRPRNRHRISGPNDRRRRSSRPRRSSTTGAFSTRSAAISGRRRHRLRRRPLDAGNADHDVGDRRNRPRRALGADAEHALRAGLPSPSVRAGAPGRAGGKLGVCRRAGVRTVAAAAVATERERADNSPAMQQDFAQRRGRRRAHCRRSGRRWPLRARRLLAAARRRRDR